MLPRNLYLPNLLQGGQESFETLLECRNVIIERIHSPAGTRSETLLQDQDEWVCLLQGEACLDMAGEQIKLAAGDTLYIPSGTPHRVMQTSNEPLCIWLAVHID